MLGKLIDINNLCYNAGVVEKKIAKTSKHGLFQALFDKWDQHGPRPKSKTRRFLQKGKTDLINLQKLLFYPFIMF